MIVFGLLILAVYIVTNTYIAVRLFKWVGLAGKAYTTVWGGVWTFLAAAFFIAELWPNLPERVSKALSLIGGCYMAAYIFLLIFVPIADIVLKGKGGPMAVAAIVGVVMIITIMGIISALNIKTQKYKVETEKIGDVTIALASDLHIGEIIGSTQLNDMIAAINACDADYVFFAGDVFDSGPSNVRHKDAIGESFKQIKAKKGVFACLGNHDGGFTGQEGAAVELLAEWGVTVLCDETYSDGTINIIGRVDKSTGGRKTPKELTEGLDMSFYTIVLDHQPYELEEEKAAGVDLVLCGHTHKGQIFPGNLITHAVYKLDYGMLREDDTTMIVSSGVGTWGPRVRLGSKSEIVSISID